MQMNLLDIHAKPFIKWVGGKRRLVSRIARRMPERIQTYYEPFLGGGALFFYSGPRIQEAVLSDKNEELITTYKVVKNQPSDLIDRLKEMVILYKKDSDIYYEVRAQHHLTDPLEIATRMIFLNKTCFNGLYNVNLKGEFNVAKGSDGRYGNKWGERICIPSDIINASKALERATLLVGEFDEVVDPYPDDFIYCDPPYDGTKIAYQKGGFGQDGQVRLRDAADRWCAAGAKVMLSNALTENIKGLYRDYRIDTLKIQYNINPNLMNATGQEDEALIMSYPADDY